MADPQTNWIDFWISLNRVAETGIWACVVGYLAFRFRMPISSVVASVSRRVERGDNVDLFGLKLEAVKATASLESDIENVVRSVINQCTSADSSQNAKELSEKVISSIRKKSFLIIDFTKVGKPEGRSVPYSQFESIGLLLRYIWVEAAVFPEHSYGRKWIIRNERTGEYLVHIGSRYARSHLGTNWDERALSAVDILVGDKISVHWKD